MAGFSFEKDRAIVAEMDGFNLYHTMRIFKGKIMKNDTYCIALKALVFIGGRYWKEYSFKEFPFFRYKPEDCRALLDWIMTLECYAPVEYYRKLRSLLLRGELKLYKHEVGVFDSTTSRVKKEAISNSQLTIQCFHYRTKFNYILQSVTGIFKKNMLRFMFYMIGWAVYSWMNLITNGSWVCFFKKFMKRNMRQIRQITLTGFYFGDELMTKKYDLQIAYVLVNRQPHPPIQPEIFYGRWGSWCSLATVCFLV